MPDADARRDADPEAVATGTQIKRVVELDARPNDRIWKIALDGADEGPPTCLLVPDRHVGPTLARTPDQLAWELRSGVCYKPSAW